MGTVASFWCIGDPSIFRSAGEEVLAWIADERTIGAAAVHSDGSRVERIVQMAGTAILRKRHLTVLHPQANLALAIRAGCQHQESQG